MKVIIHNFVCSDNPQLISLEGGPSNDIILFDVSYCNLKSLEFSPRQVQYYNCKFNKITSLKGAPRYIEGIFQCSFNPITSLDGCPEYVGEIFLIQGSTKQFTKSDIEAICVAGEIRT